MLQHERILSTRCQVEIAKAIEREARFHELVGHEIVRQTKEREAKMAAVMREQRKWEERTHAVARLIREMETRRQETYFSPLDLSESGPYLAGMLTSKSMCLTTKNDADLAEKRLREVIKASFRSPLP